MNIWKQLLDNRELKKHSTSKQEVSNLIAVVNRDIKDAGINALSDDRRFATAYNAALQLSKLVIACAGYRISSSAHHQKTFEIAALVLGDFSQAYTSYFEFCRRKRNKLDYDMAEVVSGTEVDELLKQVREFQELVTAWVKKNHSGLFL